MKAIDKANEIEIEISAAARINGAIAIYPADQAPSFIGWCLMPDADYAEIEGGKIEERSPESFLNEEGKCFQGNDEFNLFIEKACRA